VLVPAKADRAEIDRVIYKELCVGKISAQSKQKYLDIIEKLLRDGAEGVILGCTEIGLLLEHSDLSVPLFDTLVIHVDAAIEAAFAS